MLRDPQPGERPHEKKRPALSAGYVKVKLNYEKWFWSELFAYFYGHAESMV